MSRYSNTVDISNIFNVAPKIMSDTENKSYRFSLFKYIETIDHVKDCLIYLHIMHKYHINEEKSYTVDLVCDVNLDGPYETRIKLCDVEKITKETLDEILTKMFEILENIRIDKFSGEFYDSSIAREDNNKYFIDKIQKFQNIKLRCVECSVCYEMTKTKTGCGHNICIPCMTNIKRDENRDIYCPICRKEIQYIC